MKTDVLLGLQWGDEGKGKIVDFLTPKYDIIARFQGGPNAGHTIEFNNQKFVLHTIPSGIFNDKAENIIGNGVIIDPYILKKEISELQKAGIEVNDRLMVSEKAHLILPTHRLLDAVYEKAKGKKKIGSTLKGIGPAYTDKVSRNGLRVGDLKQTNFIEKYNKAKERHLKSASLYTSNIDDIKIEGYTFEEYEKLWLDNLSVLKGLKNIDTVYFLNKAVASGKKILAEGAQGTMLDIDFGSYPYVTSSNTTSAGVISGLGIPPSSVGRVYGITKAYCTRVGSGPFPTELFDSDGEKLRSEGHEFGATTGRPRRCGWLDLPALKYAVMLNGVTDIMLMKTDILNGFDTIKVAVKYRINGKETAEIPFDLDNTQIEPVYREFKGWNQSLDGIKNFDDLPAALKDYVAFIEHETKVPVTVISTGPDREETIFRGK
jgi:adenylosuccinate synthase